jgi:hypothetical protein
VVVGQSTPQAVFDVMGRKGALTAAQALLRTRYSEGLAAYRARHWDEARRSFTATLDAVPGDGPSMTFIKHIDDMIAAPPGDDWDGAWHLDQK